MVADGKITFKLDTSAEVNIIPYAIVKQFNFHSKIRKTKVKLEIYGGFKMFPLGELSLNLETEYKMEIRMNYCC